MSEATFTSILTQAPAIILALGTLAGAIAAIVVSLRNGKTVASVTSLAAKTDVVDKKADVLIEKTDVVLEQTNGNLHTTMAALELAQTKIAGLEKMIRQLSHPRIKPLSKVK